MKSRWFLLSLLLLIPGCNKGDSKNYFVVFGSDISCSTGTSIFKLVSSDLNSEYVDCFIKAKDRYEDSLSYLDKNPLVKNGNSIATVGDILNDSKYIILNYSYSAILKSHEFINKMFVYDEVEFKKDLSSIDYYLFNICQDINDMNLDAKVGICSLFDIYDDDVSKGYVDKFNQVIKDKCETFEYTYIDLSFAKVENGGLTEDMIHSMASHVKTKIG